MTHERRHGRLSRHNEAPQDVWISTIPLSYRSFVVYLHWTLSSRLNRDLHGVTVPGGIGRLDRKDFAGALLNTQEYSEKEPFICTATQSTHVKPHQTVPPSEPHPLAIAG